jgi:hypothetical protein
MNNIFNKLDIPIYITTSDNYLNVLKIYCFLFNKFWSEKQEVNIVGFKRPDFILPDNFNFISLGEQKGPQYWRRDWLKMLNTIKEDYFIHMEENELFLRPINFEVLSDLKNRLNSNIGRIGLTPGISRRIWNLVEKKENYDIIELSQSGEYRITLRASIWNKKYLEKYLNFNADDWINFEIICSQAAKNDGYNILSSNKQYVINNFDGVWHEQWEKYPNAIDFDQIENKRSNFGMKLEENVIKEMIEKNIISKNSNGLFDII